MDAFGLFLEVIQKNFTTSLECKMATQPIILMVQLISFSKSQFLLKCKEEIFSSLMEEFFTRAMIIFQTTQDMLTHGIQCKKYRNGLKKTGSVMMKLKNTKIINSDSKKYILQFSL